MLTVFGATAVTFMMLMYALERRHNGFVLAFACGCALSSVYGFLAGAWPFGVVEAIWALVAARRFFGRDTRAALIESRPQDSQSCPSCEAPRRPSEAERGPRGPLLEGCACGAPA